MATGVRVVRVFVLVVSLAACIACASLAADAQPARKARIGWLATDPIPSNIASLREGLRALGWVEGQNLVIEERYGKLERLPDLVAELVGLKVDVFITTGTSPTRTVQRATSEVPVVFVTSDPVAQGFAKSLARPGGNLTGLAVIAFELNPKRVELLKAALPHLVRLAALRHAGAAPDSLRENLRTTEEGARAAALQLLPTLDVQNVGDFERAFASAVGKRADGIIVLSSPRFHAERSRIVGLAARHRLAAMYEHRDFVDAGGLMSYGPDIRDVYRRAAGYVDRILKGTKPADLPVEQPTRFELVINLRTAKALGLTIPQTLLLRADQVID